MRLNPDCIRDIMLTLEKKLVINEYGKTIPLSFEEVSQIPSLKHYEKPILFFHLNELFECNMLKKGKRYIHESNHQIASITNTGYIFIDSIKSDTKWNKFKNSLKSMGTITLPILLEIFLNNNLGN